MVREVYGMLRWSHYERTCASTNTSANKCFFHGDQMLHHAHALCRRELQVAWRCEYLSLFVVLCSPSRQYRAVFIAHRVFCIIRFAVLLSSRKVLVLEDQFTSPCPWTIKSSKIVKDFAFCKQSDMYDLVRLKNNPLRKLEFLENDQAYFAMFFISQCEIHKFYYDTPSINKTMAVRIAKCHFVVVGRHYKKVMMF